MPALGHALSESATPPAMATAQLRIVPAAVRFPAHPPTPRAEAFAPGQTIFLHGAPADRFYEILSGAVRCCGTTEDGRRQIYRFAGEGEMLGLGSDELYSYSAEAITPVRVRRYRLSSLDTMMAEDEQLRGRIMQALRDELSAVRMQMMMLGRMSAAERIATFLRTLAARSTDDDGCVRLAMTRADIADHLGLTLETVSRKINMLKRLGIIELATPCRIRITNLDRLENFAEAA